MNNEMKSDYWNYLLICEKPPKVLSKHRLEKLKSIIWNDKSFWDDIILRHGDNKEPQLMNDKTLEHCVGNFYGMLMEAAIRERIIKV